MYEIDGDQNTIFLPLYTPMRTSLAMDSVWISNNEEENPYFYYPYLFISPFSCPKDMSSLAEYFSTTEVYADSGGFQIITQNRKLSALDIINWQEKYADVGITLDVPPHTYYKTTNKPNYDYPESYFKKCMKKSVENAEIQLEVKSNDFKLLGVIHGNTLERKQNWYEQLTRKYEFDGYCIALSDARNITGQELLYTMDMLRELDCDAHLLGATDKLMVLMTSRLSHMTRNKYTYDAASFISGQKYGHYESPYPFLNIKQLHLTKFKKGNNIQTTPCNCPVCSRHSIEELMESAHLMSLHNLFQRLQFTRYLYAISTDDTLFAGHVKRWAENERVANNIVNYFVKDRGTKAMDISKWL